MKLIFLDIDGCLNRQHFGKDERSRFGLDDGCVKRLRYILLCCPDARIVISSTWRKFEKEPRVSGEIPWIKVLEGMLHKPGTVIGTTPDLDGRRAEDGSRTYTRADEIMKYMEEFGEKIDSYVVIDDEVSCYRGTPLESNVVDCELNTGRGLDIPNACRAVRILRRTTGRKAPDDIRDMAKTLRRITAELMSVRQTAENGQDRYSPAQILLNIHEIIYSCPVDYNDERYN